MKLLSRKAALREVLAARAAHKQLVESEAAKLHDEVAAKAPVYAELQNRIFTIFSQINREALEHPERREATIAKGKESVLALRREAEAALAAAGYTPEMLRPHYTCPLCEDTGGALDGRVGRCPCIDREADILLYEGAGINGQTFERFDLNVFPDEAPSGGVSQRAMMKRLQTLALRYCDDFPHNARPNWLLLGAAGLGKTYLLNCISARVLADGHTALRLSAYRLFEAMRQYHRGLDEGDMETMLTAELLTLDDLGTEPMMANITREYLFTLLSERRNAGLATLVATNLGVQELQTFYGERVVSRLLDKNLTTIVELRGEDVRLRDRTR